MRVERGPYRLILAINNLNTKPLLVINLKLDQFEIDRITVAAVTLIHLIPECESCRFT